MGNLILHSPYWLLLIPLVPLVHWYRRRRRVTVMVVPHAATWHRPSGVIFSRWPAALAFAGLVLLAVALARPQRVEDKREVSSQGYDIMMAIDLSGSMLAEDYLRDGVPINRLQAIKPVIQAFINNRPNDRIGIVVFSGRAYTMAPLTFDHEWLARQTERLTIGVIVEDGTAIGDGLGIALTRLEQTKHEIGGRRVGAIVILLTDGANNQGLLQPEQAADIAKSRGVPVYTIGAGQTGIVNTPVFDERTGRRIGTRRQVSELDEATLREIASKTGGDYFSAADTGTIEAAFQAIDKAQKIEFQAKSYLITSELFWWFGVPGTALMILGGVLTRMPGRRLLRNRTTERQNERTTADAPSLSRSVAPLKT